MTLYEIPGVGQLPQGRPFSLTLQFVTEEGETYLDTVKFPANFLQNATPEDLARLGITVVPEPEPEPEPEEPDEEPAE